jgi:hypothetical protein
VSNGSLDRVVAAGREREVGASWQLGVTKPREIQKTLLSQLHVLAPAVEINKAQI